jgi:eukaryotic-like serine/threonine-protein kinase
VRDCLAKHPDDRPPSARELFQRYEKALGRRIIVPRRTGVMPAVKLPASAGTPASAAAPPPRTAADRHAVQHSVEAVMPESMAMMKLKGFIHDLGGDIVESVPGLIRVRLTAPKPPPKGSGLFRLLDRTRQAPAATAAPPATELELQVERRDPSQASRLTITLVLRPGGGGVTPEWRTRCTEISRDFQAYLMGR